MRIGIVGTNPRSEAIGRLLAANGIAVTMSDPRTPQRATDAAAAMGEGVESQVPYEQVLDSDIILMALPWEDLDRAVTAMGPVGDTVVVDASVPDASVRGSGAEAIARKLDSPHVVETFADLPPPGSTVALCGDDPQAKATVCEMLRTCGFTPNDLGPLSRADELERAGRAAKASA
jgi:predicted dinucleotide-binding enzyme